MNHIMQSIKIRDFTQQTFLVGAGAGREMFREIVGALEINREVGTVMVDLKGIDHVSASYFREAFVAFRNYCRTQGTQVVFVNAGQSTLEDASLLADQAKDVYLFGDEDRTEISNVHVVGRLDPKLDTTLKMLLDLGQGDAKTLKERSSEVTVITAWNNRLAALVSLGVLVEQRSGKTKIYRPVFEGLQYGN
jgi:hypothetical protein